MVDVAQLVRASVCGTEGRGFESRLPPKLLDFNLISFFLILWKVLFINLQVGLT
jgi:hypothetical protein